MRDVIYIVLSILVISAGAQVSVPIGPIQFVLSDFFVILSALVFGPRLAFHSVGFYLMLGALGLPVFADGGGGISHISGPSGGYLLGFWMSAVLVGLIAHSGKYALWKDLLAALAGYALIYFLGVSWLKFQADMSWTTAISKGMLAFLVPMGMKVTASVALSWLNRKFRIVRV